MNGPVCDYYIGDDMKLRPVMINILGNAVKFTPSGGTVTFVVESVARFNGKSTLHFIISDTGIGMSQEFLPKLFDAFSQEDSSKASRYGSTGLGMAITKNIIVLMNGTVSVESEKNKGTTFTVTVTLTDCDHQNDGEAENVLHTHELCVLVIDDDPIACEHAQLVLGQVGVNCEKALYGAEGLQMVKVRYARREPYNLILMDLRMPEMDGLEATRRIRAMNRSDAKSIPVIALTEDAFDEDVQHSMQAGLNAHLCKPVEPDVLFKTLDSLLHD